VYHLGRIAETTGDAGAYAGRSEGHVRRTLFGPRVTIVTRDGRHLTKEGTGREFIWDFEEHARRIHPVAPGLAIPETQFAELIDTCRNLDRIDGAAARLISLTIPA